MKELVDELKAVLAGRPVLDGVVPVVVFAVLASWSLSIAAIAALAVAVAASVRRRLVGGSQGWALGGVAGVALGAGLAWWMGSASGFFLPGVVRGAAVAVVGIVSLALPLPMVAWTSKVFRRWPTDWYRHRSIRPAYVETTLLWVAFFGGRAVAQWAALDASAGAQAAVAIIGGWPATIGLLVGTYLYGRWRLGRLGGPSVAEWEAGAPPPWAGQRSGF